MNEIDPLEIFYSYDGYKEYCHDPKLNYKQWLEYERSFTKNSLENKTIDKILERLK